MRRLVLGVTCLLSLASPSAAASFTIKATENDRWQPDRKRIEKGDRIVWKNPAADNRPHDVTAYGGNWDKYAFLEPGETTSKRFRKVGRYKYRCSIHSTLDNGECNGMCGVIRVVRP